MSAKPASSLSPLATAIAALDRLLVNSRELQSRCELARKIHQIAEPGELAMLIEMIRANQRAISFWLEQLEKAVTL